jgi:hypothetical protein
LTSSTVSEFNTNWASFQQKHPPPLVKYVRETWIEPHKERIIWAWVNGVLHFGHRASSRVEGSHRAVKEYILSLTGDLYITFQCLLRFWKAQHDAWQAALAEAQSRLTISARINPRYVDLLGKVSIYALNRIEMEWNEMIKERSPRRCPNECSYRDCWGLPCRHRLRYYKDSLTPIALSDIHSHWLYDRSRRPEAAGGKYPQEPEVLQQRRNANKVSHKKGHGKRSKRRDLTWTERVEQGQRQRVSGVAKAPQDDQHIVYTTGAGSVVGSGSAAPPKRLPIRTPDCSPQKPKAKKPRESSASQAVDDFYSGWFDTEWEFANLAGEDD